MRQQRICFRILRPKPLQLRYGPYPLFWLAVILIFPKSLGEEPISAPASPPLEQSPQDYNSAIELYQTVKSLFRRSSSPDEIVGRETERQTIAEFCKELIVSGSPGGLYISGSPGTGKTACVDAVCKQLSTWKSPRAFKVTRINCMSVLDPKFIFTKLLLMIKNVQKPSKDAIADLQKIFVSNCAPMSVVILDELDHLSTREQDILYKLYEWTTMPRSRLILVGIANALDLTDRLLPRLRLNNCEPKLLHFQPYSKDEILEIIRRRVPVQKAGSDQVSWTLIDSAAIELCARKISSVSGDLRKVMDICRKAVEDAETELQSLLAQRNASEGQFAAAQLPRVTVLAMQKVLTAIYGSPYLQKVRELSLQQKVLLTSLLLLRTRGQPQPPIGKAHEVYVALCQNRNLLSPMTRSEYGDASSLLESHGLLLVGKAKEERLRKIALGIQEEDLRMALAEVPLVKAMLDAGIPANVGV